MKRTSAITQSDIVRLRHLTRQIHPLGPLVTFELLRELAATSSAVVNTAESYARINPRILDLYGGRDLPPPTLWRVK